MNYTIQNSKLIITLETFEEKEWRMLEQWLSSPLHCSSKNLLVFYKNIKALRHKNQPLKKLSLLKSIMKVDAKKELMQPEEERMVKNLMYQLNLQVKSFMSWRHLQKEQKVEHKLFVDELFARKSYPLVVQELNKYEKIHQSKGQRNHTFFEDSIYKYRLLFYLDIIQNNRVVNNNLQLLLDSIRKFALAELLMYYNAAKNSEGILKVKFELPMLRSILQLLENQSDLEEPFLLIYYHMLQTFLVEEPEPHFLIIKNTLSEYASSFTEVDLRQIINLLLNRYSRKVKDGNTEFEIQKNELYRFGLKHKVWTAGLNFSTHIYIQIVKNAATLKQFEWAEKFILDNSKFLAVEQQESTRNFAKAIIHFEQGRFDKAQDIVIQFAVAQDFVYFLEYRILTLKIFYETTDVYMEDISKNPINQLLESMRQYLSSRRNRNMSEYARDTYSNFVKCFKRLWRRTEKLAYKEKVSAREVNLLIADFTLISPVKEREWLIQKAKNLISNR